MMNTVFAGMIAAWGRAYETSVGKSEEIFGGFFGGLVVVQVALESLDQFMSSNQKSIYLIKDGTPTRIG